MSPSSASDPKPAGKPEPTYSPGVAYLIDTIKSLEKRTSCLLEVARFVREIHDFHELLGRLLAKCMDLVGADAGAIALADKKTGEFSFVNVHYASLPPLEAEKKEKMLQLVRLKLADGILGRVYASGDPETVSDLSGQAAFRRDVAETVQYDVKNLMAVPLAVDGERLGVLEFLNKIPSGAFNPLDVDLASAVANQVALVVEAHRLREEAPAAPKESPPAAVREDEGLRKSLEEAQARVKALESEAAKLREASDARAKSLEEAAKAREEAASRAKASEKEAADLRGELERLRKQPPKPAEPDKAALEELRTELRRAEERAGQLEKDLESAFRLQEKNQRTVRELTDALEERKKEAHRPREHQAALMKAFSAVSSNQPTDAVLETLLGAIAVILDAEAASLLLVDDETEQLYFAAATGQRKDPLKKVLLKEGEGIAGWVAKNGRVLNIADVARDPRFSEQADKSSDFKTRSILAVPLFSESRLIGVAEAVNRKSAEAFSDEDAQTLIALSLYGAMVIRKAQIYWDMNELFLGTVRALADAIETRGAGGKGRAERVRRAALALAEELSVPTAQVRDLEIAALLHDVGKIVVPEEVLAKTEDLTEEEARLVARAPVVAAEILSVAKPLKNVVPLVRHVHERWDGQGHPDKLKGEAIPAGARLLAVAAAFEEMTADRPYRKRLPDELAVKEIQSLREKRLGPAEVDALVKLYRKGKLKDLFKA